MKILVDVRLLGRGTYSGIQEYTEQLLRHLYLADTTNHYRLFYTGFKKQPLPSWITDRPGTVLYDARIPNQLLTTSFGFLHWPAIDRFTDADLIFSPHFDLLHVRRTPRIITFHDLSFLHHPDFFNRKQALWHWLQHYRKQACTADHIIAVSEFTKSDLHELLHVPYEKISVIYSGIHPALHALPRDDAGLSAFREQKELTYPFLLYLGTLEPRKNVLAIIRAFHLLKSKAEFQHYHLVLAGRPGWLYNDIVRAAQTSPYRDHIHFWGSVIPSHKTFLYNLASAFVYPSFFEGFGFPPLEAQACGTPVVVSDRTSLPEIVGEHAPRVNPWSVLDLATAIEHVLTDTAYRNHLIHEGMRNARLFTWEHTAHQVLDLFDHVSPLSRHTTSKWEKTP
ncbi:MAG: hypothetical protein COU08_00790 [Candidatus Harrisonbacteria bacterium CG10_big_fil_rev_8_21_14_0_10_42_17]|uniref:Glycosyltransferase family 1 protein n=1 Tax=Candidatus Harrisonbacteria bacterium CG10_big_fil_rev_8_21_14_0_10_42_17 TaxID=1974584 RepID=A0A2M6WIW9_9BACT|nr:MAG: hypothetical protein COU08_00790 [Candidatus Harrisonbacteria bacterium CG10_big_fil_rev_8_21_14_0_10_42_17]